MAVKSFGSILMLVITLNLISSHPPCGLYGAPPCQFLPSLPGQTPSCARPGQTYCEHIDNYPTYLIKHLVHKWGYEAKNLIIDEIGEEFNVLRYHHHDISHFYDKPNGYHPPVVNHLNPFDGYKYENPNDHHSYPEPIFIPKPQDTDVLIYSSITAPNFKHKTNNGWGRQKVSHYNPGEWLKRYARDLSRKRKQGSSLKAASETLVDASKNHEFQENVGSVREKKYRTKRQSPGRSTLCQTNSQFIMPQAALNSKGNWMFVVNEMNAARQLVKTETCASNVCSNLCQLPNGYSSRCEQKFVQKRLVALNGNGQNLYTDTFWFPSCCVCTLSNA